MMMVMMKSIFFMVNDLPKFVIIYFCFFSLCAVAKLTSATSYSLIDNSVSQASVSSSSHSEI